MTLELSEDEKLALTAELKFTIDADRYPFSARILTLNANLDKLSPKPVREPLPPKAYAPPRATAAGDGEANRDKLCIGLVSS
jgi:hypothetical protein